MLLLLYIYIVNIYIYVKLKRKYYLTICFTQTLSAEDKIRLCCRKESFWRWPPVHCSGQIHVSPPRPISDNEREGAEDHRPSRTPIQPVGR